MFHVRNFLGDFLVFLSKFDAFKLANPHSLWYFLPSFLKNEEPHNRYTTKYTIHMKHKAIEINDLTYFRYGKILDYIALAKPRLLLMVILSAAIGFYIPVHYSVDFFLLLHLLLGTCLIGGGAHALNQWYERDLDKRMPRTATRPLPSGKLTETEAKRFGIIASIAGFLYLGLGVNWLTAGLGLLTLASYVFLYTPLKQTTVLNTWIGAIPGALPPLMGWAAAEGSLDYRSIPIFAILFFWQLPHFFAIAWISRDAYKNAGFCMLSGVDPTGKHTAFHMVSNSIFLILSSISLFALEQAGFFYLGGAVLLGVILLALTCAFMKQRTNARARQVFFASLIYLPILLLFLVFDKV